MRVDSEQSQEPSLLRAVAGNSYLLSGLYLCVGLATEGLRRLWPSHGVKRFAFALDSLPTEVLKTLGAYDWLRDHYVWGRMSGFTLRIVFGLTTMAVIFSLGLVLGTVFFTIKRIAERRQS